MIDQGYTTFGYMKMQMVVAHGGRCAECVVFGDDITDGGKDDLEKITKVSDHNYVKYNCSCIIFCPLLLFCKSYPKMQTIPMVLLKIDEFSILL